MRRTSTIPGLAAVLLMAMMAGEAAAQPAPKPPSTVEFSAGFGAFVDESPIGHSTFGVAMRAPLSRRFSVGPELVYMRGPGSDRDVFLTGNLTFDFFGPRAGQPPRVTPFLVVGAGWQRFSNEFSGRSFSADEFAATWGGGVRVWVTPRVYAAGEVRMGWEPHLRFAGVIGIALSSGRRQ